MFAIVDVETTGGHARGHGMTEIAIVISDGLSVQNTYSTLLNPRQHIPLGIQTMTGITPEMVEDAPEFSEVAEEIRAMLADHIFVAHNVHFDLGFVQSAFAGCGIEYNPKRMCSVRYARKIEKGLKSYSLKNLCAHFHIQNKNPHRGLGDATATAEILQKLFDRDLAGQWQQLIKRNSGEFNLPANLPAEQFQNLPHAAGVYYFLDKFEKPLYIGKARNLKKRVAGHFSSDKTTKRSQIFKREIHHIRYELTGSELVATLLEDSEIRQYWPPHNRAQKNPRRRFGVFLYENQSGIMKLGVNRVARQNGFLHQFFSYDEATGWLAHAVEKYRLAANLCGFPIDYHPFRTEIQDHQKGMEKLLDDWQRSQSTIAIKTIGRHNEEDGFVLVEKGHLKGIGFVPRGVEISRNEEILDYVRPLASSITTDRAITKVLGERRVEMLKLSNSNVTQL